MGIKSQIVENKTSPYPRLMVTECHDGGRIVVLFIEEKIGTCVYTSSSEGFVGEYSKHWSMMTFRDYKGTVTLSNGE